MLTLTLIKTSARGAFMATGAFARPGLGLGRVSSRLAASDLFMSRLAPAGFNSISGIKCEQGDRTKLVKAGRSETVGTPEGKNHRNYWNQSQSAGNEQQKNSRSIAGVARGRVAKEGQG